MSSQKMFQKTKLYFEGIICDVGQNTKNIVDWVRSKGSYKKYSDVQQDFILLGSMKLEPHEHVDCKCGKKNIKNVKIIFIKSLNEHHIIGNECIHRFIDNGIHKRCNKTCIKCGTPHNNRVTNYCNFCRDICTVNFYDDDDICF